MWKQQILSGIGEDPDKSKVFIKKNIRNHSYHKFYPVLAKIRINRVLLYFRELWSPVHVDEEHKGQKWCAVPACSPKLQILTSLRKEVAPSVPSD